MLRFLSVIGTSVLLACTAFSVAKAEPVESELPEQPKSGRYSLVIDSEGYERVAHVRVPKDYRPGTAMPLVVALHGAGGDGALMLDRNGWSERANLEGFLVVAPTALPTLPRLAPNFRLNPRIWNSGQLNPRSPRALIDDVAYMAALLDELKTRVDYDPARVFLVGHSNGGAMAFRLAAELPDRFVALAPVAATMPMREPQLAKPIPTLFIVGDEDPLQPLAGGEVDLPWGTRIQPPVADALAVWAKAMQCSDEPQTKSDEGGLKWVEYPSTTTDGPTLTVCYVQGQGHGWPGGQRVLAPQLLGPESIRLDATKAIWEFFAETAKIEPQQAVSLSRR